MPLRVLISCEFSGIVREEFRVLGHDAWSCDLLPTEIPGPHIQGDVLDILHEGWDMMLAFPPCTYLCNSGARWHSGTTRQEDALDFVRALLAAPIPRIVLENPEGKISTAIRRPNQIIQPWLFGDKATKKTHLWLKGLPLLQPTKLAWPRPQTAWRMGQSKERAQNRSRTYPGIAQAFAAQYGTIEKEH